MNLQESWRCKNAWNAYDEKIQKKKNLSRLTDYIRYTMCKIYNL